MPKDFFEKKTRLLKSFSGNCCCVDVIRMSDAYNSVAINNSHISTATLYRLMIPSIAKHYLGNAIDSCIYLDSDAIVEGDITELFNVNVEGFCIARVWDPSIASEKWRSSKQLKELKNT